MAAQVQYAPVSPQPNESWGWFPALMLLNAFALTLTAVAFSASRTNNEWGTLLFWLSLLPVSYTHLTLPTSDLV